MKIAYASDLHLEFGPIAPHELITDADYLFLPGDIAEAKSFQKALNESSGDHELWRRRLTNLFEALSKHYEKIILVAGNHEYYHSRLDKAERIIREFCSKYHNVVFLQNEMVVERGLKIFGATMWTDMGLHKDPLMEFKLKMSMNDFRLIDFKRKTGYGKFNPHNAAAIHCDQLNNAVALQPDIIIQHHAPTEKSVPKRFKGHELNPAYFSESMEDALIDRLHPRLIIHGHIHGVHDYTYSKTRVVGNSRGYVGMEDTDSFQIKVIDI